jgi:hypothetical protein
MSPAELERGASDPLRKDLMAFSVSVIMDEVDMLTEGMRLRKARSASGEVKPI